MKLTGSDSQSLSQSKSKRGRPRGPPSERTLKEQLQLAEDEIKELTAAKALRDAEISKSRKELDELNAKVEKLQVQRAADESAANNTLAALKAELTNVLESQKPQFHLIFDEIEQQKQQKAIAEEQETLLHKVRELKHSSGEIWSCEESSALIQCITMMHLNCNLSIRKACEIVSGCGRSLTKLKEIMTHWKLHGKALCNDGKS